MPAPRLFRSGLRLLLGTFPHSCPLAAETVERVDLGEGVREKVRYQVEPGEWAPAYLFLPAGLKERSAAVLCLHQHAGQFDLGKSEPAGLAGNPQQFYALELARRGYVTLAADALCFEERRDPVLEGAAFERFSAARLGVEGSCLQTKMLSDAMRGVDYLLSRPEVNAARIGCIGHSLGGQQTMFTTAMDERIRAAVSSCGFASYASLFRDRINHNYAAYVPGLLRFGEVGDVLALAAPRPFLVLAGNADRIFPFDGIVASVERARERYRALDAEERLGFVPVDAGHAFSDDMRQRAYAWFDQWLRQS
ncbi:MAG TPA: prolyl oligopeptidase family serine peptidase [Chloroflexota bacterium]|nr:prolyl oligopeptidase family serine peptidase [Chloroflexota bacterium]